MTDKQIIIDGVDVSGCEYHSLNKNNCSLCSLSNNLICSYKPFCYYKQLKRKEQECERLEETFDGLFKVQYELADNNKKLHQCLTEIKELAKKVKVYDPLAKQILQKISEVEDGV